MDNFIKQYLYIVLVVFELKTFCGLYTSYKKYKKYDLDKEFEYELKSSVIFLIFVSLLFIALISS